MTHGQSGSVRKFSARRVKLLAAVGLTSLMLAGCVDYGGIPKHLRPLPASTKQLIESKDMKQTSPILIRIFKEESELEVWKQVPSTGKYALLKSYEICKWSGELGPKHKEGDRQAPEGFYTIAPAQMNPNSSYHLSFNMGFPNTYDQAHGRTGSHLMVHGSCSSAGCYAMEDEQIEEIYTLARLSFQGGQRAFQVQAYPFRMTPENLARHRHDDDYEFWRMLKEGNDHFEVTRQPPKVDVCSKRYVFNSTPVDGVEFSSTAECPALDVPDSIEVAVQDKMTKDDAKKQIIVAKLEREDEKARLKDEKQRLKEQRKAERETMIAAAQPAPVAAAPSDAVLASSVPTSGLPAIESAATDQSELPAGQENVVAAYTQQDRGRLGRFFNNVAGLIR